MAQRVVLDAMIPRADFARYPDRNDEPLGDQVRDFPISYLSGDSPILRQLRKPDFQRETNHWTPSQIAEFIESFVDAMVIPSLILWKSPSFIFVIDGGHRLSALRAWVEDDYGDGPISQKFFGNLTKSQKAIAKRTRKLVEDRVDRYTTLRAMAGDTSSTDPKITKRVGNLHTRPLQLQWVVGNAQVAESSFFKINSQGTPLDDVERLLIEHRATPIAIGARAIMRAGSGHKYWSKFDAAKVTRIESLAAEFFDLLFQPEVTSPLRTLDVPLGGAVSPVEALSLLVEFLSLTGAVSPKSPAPISDYAMDDVGDGTIDVLVRSLKVVQRVTGDKPPSLGLHPAVYFYNENGKHSRFLFLGMVQLIAQKLESNNDAWFKKFTKARAALEKFLIREKSLIGFLLQNMNKKHRVRNIRDLLEFLIDGLAAEKDVSSEDMIRQLGIRGKVLAGTADFAGSTRFTDDTKSRVFVHKALESAPICSYCGGYLDTPKSVSYDHKVAVKYGGDGSEGNLDLLHPYCNSIKDS